MKKNGKRLVSLVVTLGLLFTLAACSSPAETAPTPAAPSQSSTPNSGDSSAVAFPEMEITIAHSHGTDSLDDNMHIMAATFKDYVEEATNGAVKVKIVGENLLGSDAEEYEQMKLGELEMCIVGNSVLASDFAPLQITMLPFMFSDVENVVSYTQSDLFLDLLEQYQAQTGIHVLTSGINGFRQMMSPKYPINSVEDFDGRKWRIVENDLYKMTYDCLGANPTPVSGAEMFTATQQGVVDGLCLPLASGVADGFTQIIKYCAITNHMYTSYYMCMGSDCYDNVPAELQKIFDEAGKAAEEAQIALSTSKYEKDYQSFVDAGCTMIDNPDLDSMVAAVQPVYEHYRDIIGADFFDASIAQIKG